MIYYREVVLSGATEHRLIDNGHMRACAGSLDEIARVGAGASGRLEYSSGRPGHPDEVGSHTISRRDSNIIDLGDRSRKQLVGRQHGDASIMLSAFDDLYYTSVTDLEAARPKNDRDPKIRPRHT